MRILKMVLIGWCIMRLDTGYRIDKKSITWTNEELNQVKTRHALVEIKSFMTTKYFKNTSDMLKSGGYTNDGYIFMTVKDETNFRGTFETEQKLRPSESEKDCTGTTMETFYATKQ